MMLLCCTYIIYISIVHISNVVVKYANQEIINNFNIFMIYICKLFIHNRGHSYIYDVLIYQEIFNYLN